MKKIIPAAVLAMAASSALAVTPVNDSFNYPANADLNNNGGWLGTGGGISVTATSLNYTSAAGTMLLPASTGGAALLTMANAKAEKINTGQFPTVSATPSVIYYSFVLQVTDPTGATAGGGFLAGFNNTVAATGTTSVGQAGTRMIIAKVLGNTDPLGYNIALQNDVVNTQGTAVKVFDVNRTGGATSAPLFIVGAYYNNINSTTDDVAALWINPEPASFGSQTPPAPTLTSTGQDLNIFTTTGIASFFLRQNTAGGKSVTVDDVRLDTSWSSVAPLQWTTNASGLWAGSSNWTTNVAPNAAGLVPSFNGNATGVTVTLDTNQTAGGLTFNATSGGTASAFIIASSGGTLALEASSNIIPISATGTGSAAATTAAASTVAPTGTIVTVNAGNQSITAPVALNSNTAIFAAAGTSLSMSGAISGTGGITKTGTGSLSLLGNNSYTGPVTVNGGFVHANSDTSFGAVPASPTVNVNVSAGVAFDTSFAVNANRTLALVTGGKFSTNSTNNTWAGKITGTGSLEKVGGGTLVLSGPNDYTGNTTVTTGTLALGSSLTTSPSIVIAPNAAVTLTTNGSTVLSTNALAMDSTSTLNLNDNDLILNYSGGSPIGTVRSLLVSGFNGGGWDGKGINSTVAGTTSAGVAGLGYAEATDVGLTTLDGVSIPGTAVVVKYTYYGDSNLDGTVGTDDFMRFLDGFAGGGNTWLQGDFTYDGVVDLGNDFNLFLSGYMLQGGALGDLAPIIDADTQLSAGQKASLLAVVPEPSSIAAIAVAATGLAARRRRRIA